MKKLFTLGAFIFCAFSIFSQVNTSDMIVDVYGQNQYNQWVVNNPGQIELLEQYVLDGIQVIPTNDKYNSMPELTEIPLRSKNNETISIQDFLLDYDSGSFNPLVYGFFPTNETQLFKLQGTNKAVLINRQSIIVQQ